MNQQEIAHQIKMLNIYRSNLRILINQAAMYGEPKFVPLYLVNNILMQMENIQRIKDSLGAHYTEDAIDRFQLPGK